MRSIKNNILRSFLNFKASLKISLFCQELGYPDLEYKVSLVNHDQYQGVLYKIRGVDTDFQP